MKRKLQVVLSEGAWVQLEAFTKDANDGFNNGSITLSDVVNELVLTAKIDIKSLQGKHINVRKSLRLLATQKEIDIDLAIKTLMDLKSKGAKRTAKNQLSMEGDE